MNKPIIIAPSILSGDFANFAESVRQVESAGADWIHCDVMDGHFVPNITFGANTVKALRKYTGLPLDVHLMISNPADHIDSFCDAGASWLTIHYEAHANPKELLEKIRAQGVKAGLSIKPATRPEKIFDLLSYCDIVLVMTVEPGFGGQSFMYDMLDKIRKLKSKIDELGLDVHIEVDGGINQITAKEVISAGANVLVAGETVFKAVDMKKTIRELR